ncbi:MAG TPA: hypothetical protein VH542_11320 [Steroidobacteraceae bacterium]|jgi:hypothetical protein
MYFSHFVGAAVLAACAPCAAAAMSVVAYPHSASQGTLLVASQGVAHEVEDARRAQVRKVLRSAWSDTTATSLRVVSSPVAISPTWGATADRSALSGMQVIATRIASGGRRSSIPFGFAGIAWGLCHPADAWRLLFPVPL